MQGFLFVSKEIYGSRATVRLSLPLPPLLQVIVQQAKRITELEQRVKEIKRQLGQFSSNSSTSPSSDGFRKSNNHFVCPVEIMELPKAARGKHSTEIPPSSWNFSRYFVRTRSFRMISWKNSRYFHAVQLHCRIRVKLAGGFPVSYSIFQESVQLAGEFPVSWNSIRRMSSRASPTAAKYPQGAFAFGAGAAE
jgi:hypothetical protein